MTQHAVEVVEDSMSDQDLGRDRKNKGCEREITLLTQRIWNGVVVVGPDGGRYAFVVERVPFQQPLRMLHPMNKVKPGVIQNDGNYQQ